MCIRDSRLTAEEKEIKAAVMDTLKGQIAYNNDGMRASYRVSNHSFNLLARCLLYTSPPSVLMPYLQSLRILIPRDGSDRSV